jgi:hypothetical protein
MNLITTYYISENIDRQNELKKCLIKNIQNKYIQKIYLLNSEIYDLDFIMSVDIYNKVTQIQIYEDSDNMSESKNILKYSDAIDFINKNLGGSLCILANSDIYFNETLSKISYESMHGKFYALLRYDEEINGKKTIFKRHDIPRDDSQDAWIFNSPLQINLMYLDFRFGTLGCDSIFANAVHDNTFLKVSNPAYDIITTHVHQTQFRTYNCDDRIHGKYALIKPTNLNLDDGDDNNVITFMDY